MIIKYSCLANNDRFSVDEYMHLLGEISNLKNIILAIVSRGSVLYIIEKI